MVRRYFTQHHILTSGEFACESNMLIGCVLIHFISDNFDVSSLALF